MNRKIPAIHPGEILLEEFMQPYGITQYQLAKAINVPTHRIYEIVHGRRRITADTALRLARYFSIETSFWLNLQNHYDVAIYLDSIDGDLEDIEPFAA